MKTFGSGDKWYLLFQHSNWSQESKVNIRIDKIIYVYVIRSPEIYSLKHED